VSWAISIPYRTRDDSLSDVFEAARVLPTDEARVTRQLVLDEIAGGSTTTAGELIDQLEKATPAARRAMLDAARVEVGLPDTAELEFRARFEVANAGARARAGSDHRQARFGYNESGLLVDLNERDDEIARAQAQEESRRRLREDRKGAQTAAAAEHATIERARGQELREQSRNQSPWSA
jgi:hypothetical protein